MLFIGVEVEQETSAPPPKKNPGSAPDGGAIPMSAAFVFAHVHFTYKGLKASQWRLSECPGFL